MPSLPGRGTGGRAPLTEACAPYFGGDTKFIELLKRIRTFNHKTNDKSASKNDYKL